MAVLRRSRDGRTVSVGAYTLIGRYPSCDLVLSDSRVSGNHLLLLHDDTGWFIKPHLTTNATLLAGVPIPPGRRHPVENVGLSVQVGTPDEVWTWLDLSPPGPAATDAEDRLHVTKDRVLVLPNEQRPWGVVVSIGDQWFLQAGEDRVGLVDNQIVELDRQRFRLHLPKSLVGGSQRTAEANEAPPVALELVISANGDEILRSCLISVRDRRELRVRRHTHLLLELAEARVADANSDLAESERGWVDTNLLRRRLGLSAQQLYVQTFRARAQLEDAAPASRSLLEVRGEYGRRQLRLGIHQVSVRSNS
ncbi:MAG: FHA domain-containing protein [Myxococcota bacterium]